MDIKPKQQAKYKIYVRRTIAVFIGFFPLILLIASLIIGVNQNQQSVFASVGFMFAALVLALFNFHLSFIRPYLYQKKHNGMDGYHFVSGLPIIGNILIIIGLFFGFGGIGSAVIGILAFALDTGGTGWFLVAVWGDKTFWTRKAF
jgi:hypothetical protein